jgi:predicted transcriptional regulator
MAFIQQINNLPTVNNEIDGNNLPKVIKTAIDQKYDHFKPNAELFCNNLLNNFFETMYDKLKKHQTRFIYKINMSTSEMHRYNSDQPKLGDLMITKIGHILTNKGYYYTQTYENINEYDYFDMINITQTFCIFDIKLVCSKL